MINTHNMTDFHPKDVHVAVLMGGNSSEHQVSLDSGREVVRALQKSDYNVYPIILKEEKLPAIPHPVDVIFPALHGGFGEDGRLQKLLETLGIPYVGSDAVSSSIMINKQLTKKVLAEASLPVVSGKIITKDNLHNGVKDITLPAIVKPNKGGSTLGLQLVNEKKEWYSAIRKALQYDHEILVENYIAGTEITVGILHGEVLPIVEIIPPGKVFDYDAKYVYSKGKTNYFCPPISLKSKMQKVIQSIAIKTYKTLKAKDILRIDMIIESISQSPFILEVNSMPGFTENSLFPKSCSVAGISFHTLCSSLVYHAYR